MLAVKSANRLESRSAEGDDGEDADTNRMSEGDEDDSGLLTDVPPLTRGANKSLTDTDSDAAVDERAVAAEPVVSALRCIRRDDER
jgi:hypothetical protein